MPGVSISLADLTPFVPDLAEAKANAMIEDAMALAVDAAPCLDDDDLDPKKARAAKAVLRGAILRWIESGQGGRGQVTDVVGPFQHAEVFDTTKPRRSMFWPSEIVQLQKICTDAGSSRRAWGYDTAGSGGTIHATVCSLNLGAAFCSCGADLAGSPLWENDGGD